MEEGMKTEIQTRLTIAAILIVFFLCMVIYNTIGLVSHLKKESERKAAATAVEPYDPYDYVMKSLTARSNAMYFGKPPDGIQIVCDDSGLYAPREIWSEINPNAGFVWGWNDFVRTNRQDAIVAAWRVKEILDNRNTNSPTPPPPPVVWKPCD